MHLSRLAATYGAKPAVVMANSREVMTYRELEERSNRIAQLFRQRGLRPGDHIAILLANQIELFPIVWAAQRSGLLYTPVNWHLSEAEAAYIVADCGARMLISAASLEPVAAAAATAAPALESRVVVGDVAGQQSLDDAVAGLPASPIDDEVEGNYMFYSSGTTGRPKGITPELSGAPFGTGLTIDTTMATAFGFSADSVYLCPGPLYHAAPLGWSIGTIRNGGTVVVMERFDARQVLELVQEQRVTHGQFVPTMFVRMLKLDSTVRAAHDLSSLQVVVHAAAPCPVEVKQKMIDWVGPILLEYYAGSEGNGFCMIDSPTWLERRGSVGRALIGEVHVCDGDGVELEPGQIGTIWFGGTKRFAYHNDPGKTASAYNDRGWSTLGDLGHVDPAGFVYLSDRRSDLIISGGVNVYPREIEDVLVLHPAVADVAVIGLPDEEMGQRVHAVVQPAAQELPDTLADELIAFCRERIAGFKVPRTFTFDREFPRLPSGKVLRRVLVERYGPASSSAASSSAPSA
ncbi:acyl-CoA synthetase [Pseudonocardia kunmingensis]|uniref:Acyl-CoA synthetase (AMP-forming)/AMP-acid ligase II n=1 Tax=Pseudonocardia kunmingensis TaxID=630975 RepID=A0A543DPX2_9PSEU|nr:acyl-CoA synthetase [Pseudonocardia kunmingensis]TQM11354.1 acyl-CoA synthetase (AMP-forming)/AMP-acid ligase II [Pseudonocardia kunmingensis]